MKPGIKLLILLLIATAHQLKADFFSFHDIPGWVKLIDIPKEPATSKNSFQAAYVDWNDSKIKTSTYNPQNNSWSIPISFAYKSDAQSSCYFILLGYFLHMFIGFKNKNQTDMYFLDALDQY